MNPRIVKEIRQLFWPWCLMVIAALAPLLGNFGERIHVPVNIVWVLGLYVGIPLLAVFSMGAEFQQHTFPMLLGQPIGRLKLWKEKQGVLLSALLLAGLVFFLTRPKENELNGDALVLFGVWLLATLCSATFWTLVARSVIGGVAFGQMAQFILGAALVNLGAKVFGAEPSGSMLIVAEVVGAAVCVAYSALTLWIGGRLLLRFQTTGGLPGTDLLMAGPRVLPTWCANVLRCRANSPTLNLIRKELRLLRPLWLIMLLFIVCWICVLITVHFLPQTVEWSAGRGALPVILLVAYVPLALFLAGSLSLGEERSSGTHAWHLTLPVSVRRQWFIKLATSHGAGTFSAILVPFLVVTIGQALLGLPFGPDFHWDFKWGFSVRAIPNEMASLTVLLFLSFPAFWCASAVNGATRAAIWTIPVLALLSFVGGLGAWIAAQTASYTCVLVTVIISHFELNPGTVYRRVSLLVDPTYLIFPVLLVAVVQSYRLFRIQVSDAVISTLRKLLPLAIMVLSLAWLLWSVAYSGQRIYSSNLVAELRGAVRVAAQSAGGFDEAHPLVLTVDDLEKLTPLSKSTRRWLSHTTITVIPTFKQHRGWYNFTIIFKDGSKLTLSERRD